MSRWLVLVKGFSGHPLHPPLTDGSIGAYTAGVLMLVLGALGLEEREMAHRSLLATSLGLLLAPPTVPTGIVLFVLTWLAHLAGYEDVRSVRSPGCSASRPWARSWPGAGSAARSPSSTAWGSSSAPTPLWAMR